MRWPDPSCVDIKKTEVCECDASGRIEVEFQTAQAVNSRLQWIDAGCGTGATELQALAGSPTSFQGQGGAHLFGRCGNRTWPKQSIFGAPIPGEKLQEEIHFQSFQQRHFLRFSYSTRSLSLLEVATPASPSFIHSFQQPSGGPFATLFSPSSVSNCRPARRRDLSLC
jgi:hypothetical protein